MTDRKTARPIPVAACALAALLFLAAPRAFGLATEHFGNAPVPDGWGFAPGLIPLLNDTRRIYWYEVNGDASFYFQGDTAAAQETLRRFAALEKGMEVIILPGPRELTSLTRERKFSADWELHIPGGFHLGQMPDGGLVADTKPTLYLFVRADRPAALATPAQVARWLTGLNADEFDERERATRELEKQGRSLEADLRKALAAKPAAEARRRIGLLLERLPGINLGMLTVPEGVHVQGPDDLLVRYRKGLKSENSVVRGVAAGCVASWEPDAAAALAVLTKALADKNEYVKRCAAGDLGRLGKAATAALPALRAGLEDPDKNVRNALESAIKEIESAKEAPGAAERLKNETLVRAEIGLFVKALSMRAKE